MTLKLLQLSLMGLKLGVICVETTGSQIGWLNLFEPQACIIIVLFSFVMVI